MSQSEDSTPRKSKAHNANWVDYLWIIRDHIWIAMAVAAIVAAVYFVRKSDAIPLYRSSAIVLFELQRDNVINVQEVQGSIAGRGYETTLRNHLTDLRSNSFRNRIIDSFSPEEIATLRRGYATPDNPEPSLHGIIAGANRIRIAGGNIFNFEFHHRNPAAAALLANRFVEEFNDVLFERARRSNDSAIRFLRSQSEELKLRVERSELAVQRYRQERNLVSLEESQNLIVDRMKNISGTLNGAKIELINLTASIERIDQVGEDPDVLITLPAINSRSEVAAAIQIQRSLRAERESMAIRYGSRHPRMIQNATQIASNDAQIDMLVRKAVTDIRQQHADLTQRVKSLSEALATAEQESLELDQIAIEYNVLRRKLETDQRLFTQVHQRLNEALLASQLTDTNLRIIDAAFPSGSPFTPDTTKTTSMTIMLFLGVTVAVPYALHFLNLKLKSATEIEQHLEIPYLGEIRKLGRKLKSPHSMVLERTDEHGVESFRQILSQVLLRLHALPKGYTLVISSALPKEGKSFFSTNLAATFARHHHRTLLVDCDFRRPTIATVLKGFLNRPASQPTSSDDLASAEAPASTPQLQALPSTPFLGQPIPLSDSLFVLPAIQSTNEATEFLNSPAFKEELSQFRQQFDVIIIDTPPAGLFPDAALIAEHADNSIFITQLNKHRKSFLIGVVDRLRQSDAALLGVVVNKVTRRKARHLGAYKYADYQKYKSYYPSNKGLSPSVPSQSSS